MREAIRRAVKGLFPELGAGLHLDRYARVLAVADAPGQGAASERFRPRYAVDIQILTADGEPDPAFPTYTAVPLPVPTGAGQEKGFFSSNRSALIRPAFSPCSCSYRLDILANRASSILPDTLSS